MKKLSFSILCFLVIIFSLTTRAQNAKIGLISDLHYTHPSLIAEEGEALNNYLRHDRKLLLESHALLKKSVENLLNENVNIVLIPGDLTKDGEMVSHQGVAKLLKPLKDKGVKILVIPGNHDIDNPDAVSFHGDKTRQVSTVSPSEFKQIYHEYGYGNAVSVDNHSLSYVSEPIEGLRIICIDACKYYDNTFVSRGANRDSCVTHGVVKPETMHWIKTEIRVAKLLNKKVIAQLHHGVVEHFDYQSFFARPYLVDNYREVQKMFMEEGLNVVFTGHFHASDIAKAEDKNGNYIYDIETGSIVTYPCPYRIIDFSDNQIFVETKFIQEIDYPLPHNMNFQQYAQSIVETGFQEMLPALINEYYDNITDYYPKWLKNFIKLPEAERLSEIFLSNLSPSAVHMLVAHYGGNENEIEHAAQHKQELLSAIDQLISELCRESLGPFATIGENIIMRKNVVKKAKMSIASIWDNHVSSVKRTSEEYAYIRESVNDLSLTLALQDMKETPNNTYFYAYGDGNEEIKVGLFGDTRNKKEKWTMSENKSAILSRRIDVVTE